ncbi:hypothetical protein K469DRAFT_378451 [Zopfia rhizophila CBS 207.26]|uniref:Uncharacterized protein n=1 Tax=Zopfia rhizophila CBS 207.26 TaxID=1314779 RepID=A0A6A6DCX4_9PEZI|nr:hypothetical protein K469DRAFT_378451 [Zopfia rhizophila CBS 207.26]
MLCLNLVVVIIVFGRIYLGWSVAFNAIAAASVVALGLRYGIPVALNLAQPWRKFPDRTFKLPEWLGLIECSHRHACSCSIKTEGARGLEVCSLESLQARLLR